MSASLHFLTRVLFVSIMALKSIHNDLGNCSFCVSSYLFLNETFNSQLIQGSHFRRKKACISTPPPSPLPPTPFPPSPHPLPPSPPHPPYAQGYGESLHFCAGQTNFVENCGSDLTNRSFDFTARRRESACKH